MSIEKKNKLDYILAYAMLTITAIVMIILVSASISMAGQSSKKMGFKIISFDLVWDEYDNLYAIGEIKNIGAIAASPKVEVIVRDKNGVLVDSAQFWPNSVSNLPPGSSCGIKYPITEDRRAVKGGIKVIGANIW